MGTVHISFIHWINISCTLRRNCPAGAKFSGRRFVSLEYWKLVKLENWFKSDNWFDSQDWFDYQDWMNSQDWFDSQDWLYLLDWLDWHLGLFESFGYFDHYFLLVVSMEYWKLVELVNWFESDNWCKYQDCFDYQDWIDSQDWFDFQDWFNRFLDLVESFEYLVESQNYFRTQKHSYFQTQNFWIPRWLVSSDLRRSCTLYRTYPAGVKSSSWRSEWFPFCSNLDLRRNFTLRKKFPSGT